MLLFRDMTGEESAVAVAGVVTTIPPGEPAEQTEQMTICGVGVRR